ncbi:hypothetical protein [Streptomyces sp. NPDC008125]|uniref:hypothetical protein n=1 Tax=Streptomyces sp. NPDC008125 TaxID=3364811 RepID=UPI0036EACD45
MQQVQESGGAGSGSETLGLTMLAFAALPVVAALLVLMVSRATRIRCRRAAVVAAAVLFFGGLASFLLASLLAMA